MRIHKHQSETGSFYRYEYDINQCALSFQKMDLNRDGVLTLDEFLDCCLRDEDISRSMGVFDSNF